MKNRKKLISILAGIMAVVMVLSLLLSLIPAARAASSGEIRDQINDMKAQQSMIRQEKDALREQYKKNEDEIADLVDRKVLIDNEIFLIYAEIGLMNEQISAFALLIADKQSELEEAEHRFRVLNDEYKDRIRIMEEEGTMSYWEVIFRAKSFADLLDRLNMIQEIAAADRRRLQNLSDAADEVADAKNVLEQEMAALEETHQQLNDTYDELSAKKQEAEATLAELIERGYELEDLYDSIEDEEAALLAEIAQLEKEYTAAKYEEWLAHIATATTATTAPTTAPTTEPEVTTEATTGTTEPTRETEPPVTTEPSKETEPPATTEPTETTAPTEGTEPPETTDPPETTPPSSESWIRPCNYVMLTSPFGYRDAPTDGASTYHQGVDLAGPEGTPSWLPVPVL